MADGSYAYGSTPSPEELAKFDLNDFGNAMRLIRLVGGEVDAAGEIDLTSAQLLYLREIGWIGWNGRHWDQRLGQRLAERTAHKVAQGLVAQREHLFGDKKLVDGFIRSAGNAGAVSAMLKVAESYLQVELEEFDRDPMAFTVRNGTLMIRREAGDGMKVSLEKHDPRHRITRMAQVDYDPKATAKTWAAKLAFWQPEEAMRGYLQRLAGYTWTGHTHEQVFVVFQGKGGDGKSTYMNVLRELFGGYGDVADVRTFLDTGQRGGAEASPDLARLAGDCRIISVAEPPRGAKLNEAMIKSFTGGQPIVARRLRQDLFSFEPKPKVYLEANSRPVIRGDDEGIWRRIRLVMWEHSLTKAQMDSSLPEQLRAEYSGILNWVLQGVGDWLSEGLAEPQRVREALDDYRKGSSPFGEWFLDCVDLDAEACTPASHFYSSYKEWSETNGIEPMKQTAFGNALADRQIIRTKKNSAGNVMRKGARLRERGAPLAPLPEPLLGASSAGGSRGSEPGEGEIDPTDYGFGDGQ